MCAVQVMNAFAPDLEKDEAVRLFRSSKHILQPFITDMTHPPKLFFFFQPRGSGKNPERHLFITVGMKCACTTCKKPLVSQALSLSPLFVVVRRCQ